MTQTALVVHATKAYARPKTVKAPAKAKAKAKTNQEMRDLLATRGIKSTTKHTKAELIQMLKTGQYAKPAAYARDAANRKAKKAA